MSTSKRIEHHTYYVNRSINLDGHNSEEFNFTLYNFHLLTEDKHIRVKNTGVDLYEIGTNAMAGLSWNRFLMTYPQNIFKMFQRSELKYLNLYEYKDIEELSFMYKYRALLETVLNLGGTRMFNELMCPYTRDMRTLTRRFIKRSKFLIKKYNFTVKDCLLKNKLDGLLKMSPKNLKAIASGDLSNETYVTTVELSKKYDLDRSRAISYVIKNDFDFITYRDYLNMIVSVNLKVVH